jgi:hypothetical protein
MMITQVDYTSSEHLLEELSLWLCAITMVKRPEGGSGASFFFRTSEPAEHLLYQYY